MSSRLTDQQIAHYREQGYLLFDKPVFSSAKFAALRGRFEAFLERWTRTMDRSPEHIDGPHFTDPKLLEWLTADEVLDLVEPLIGPDIAIFSSHFLCKPAGIGKRVPWHEDASYWRSQLDPVEVCTVWIAIDRATTANGCMRVVPGTHRTGGRQHHKVADLNRSALDYELDTSTFDESTAIDCVLEPNHCSLHHANLIHGSNANESSERRCGYNIRYMPTTVKAQCSSGRQLYLARGRDRAGNTYGQPGKVNELWLEHRPQQRGLVTTTA